jgi:hypothetical protein
MWPQRFTKTGSLIEGLAHSSSPVTRPNDGVGEKNPRGNPRSRPTAAATQHPGAANQLAPPWWAARRCKVWCHSRAGRGAGQAHRSKRGRAPPVIAAAGAQTMLVSTSRPAGGTHSMRASTVCAERLDRSMRRWCVRTSKCSRASLFTWGERSTQ